MRRRIALVSRLGLAHTSAKWVQISLEEAAVIAQRQPEDTYVAFVHFKGATPNKVRINAVSELSQEETAALRDMALGQAEKPDDQQPLVDEEDIPTKLTEEQDDARRRLLKRYEHVFNDAPTFDQTSGRPPDFDMLIKLVDETAVPPRRPPRRLSPADFKELQKQLEILLKANLIRPSNSPYGAPVLFVPKKGGKRRFAVDFRALNDRTIRDVTPLPRTDDLLQALNGARVFSKLDASWMFWQLHIKEEDTHKLGMVTPLGLFEWRVAPFGITNAPGHCMRVMNNVLRPFLHKFCQVMLDDIIVYSKTVEEHTEHLSQILAALDEARIFMKPSKCAFFLDSVVYLSHVVSANGIAPCRFILDAVEKFPEPKSVTEIRGFLGLCNYYSTGSWCATSARSHDR